MKKQFLTVVNSANDQMVGVILIPSTLSSWNDPSGQFSKAVDDFIAQGATSIEVILNNCYGGNVFEGAVICSIMDKCPIPINTKYAGLCASMGSAIFAKGKRRLADTYGTLLTHRASMEEYGCYETLANTSANLKKINDGLAQLYADATGMSIEDVHANLMPFGKDIYHTTQECIDNGLATGKWESGIKAAIPLEVLAKSEMKAVAEFYDKQLENSNTPQTPPMDKKIIALAIGAPADADETTITNSVTALVADKKKLEDRVTALEKEKEETAKKNATDFVTAAFDRGQITAKEKTSFEKLAQGDFESVKAIIDSRPVRETAASKVASGTAAAASNDVNAQKEGEGDDAYYERLYKMPGGEKVLDKIESTEPDRFKKLKAAYVESRK